MNEQTEDAFWHCQKCIDHGLCRHSSECFKRTLLYGPSHFEQWWEERWRGMEQPSASAKHEAEQAWIAATYVIRSNP